MDTSKNWGSKECLFKTLVVLGGFLCVLALAITIKQLASLDHDERGARLGEQKSTISVNGTGEESAVPDIATFGLTVTENAKTVSEAQTKATAKTNAAIKALKDAGIADKDIKTSGYAINPRYEYQQGICAGNYCPPGKTVLTGYEVSQSIDVKVRDLTKAGDILNSIGSIGVQNVNGLTFTIDSINDVKAAAQAKAIEDAKAKADKLAKALGVHIKGVASFSDNTTEPPVYYRGAMAMDSANQSKSAVAPAPQLPAGEQKIVSNVTITYEIR